MGKVAREVADFVVGVHSYSSQTNSIFSVK